MPTAGELDRSASGEPGPSELAERMRASGIAVPVPTAASYDATTEGKTGWRFVLAPRWLVFIGAALLFTASCVLGVVWQAAQWTQINGYNAIVERNFHAVPVPLGELLPATNSYRASVQWRPITVTGRYLTVQQLYVRDRSCATIDNGFEVLTPLRLAGGSELIIDRGCVAARTTDSNLPVATPAPPSGQVTVIARVVASESNQGAISGDQVESIDARQIAGTLGGTVYTAAYGMLVSQTPAATIGLSPVISGRPLIDTTTQTVTIFAMVLYVLVGLSIFAFALREKFRWVNRFSPRLWAREVRRIQRLSRKAYTDEELEDQQVRRDAAAERGTAHTTAAAPTARSDSPEDQPLVSAPELPESRSDAGLVVDGGSFQWTDGRVTRD